MRVLFSLAMVIGTFVGCLDAQTRANKPEPYIDPEAYAVYSEIIMKEWPVRVAKAKGLIIHAENAESIAIGSPEPMCLRPAADEEATFAPIIAEYKRINAKKWLFREKLNIILPYQIVSKVEIKASFVPNGHESFYKRFPDSGGYIQMSAVAFNKEKTIAIVYMAHSCGLLCAGGTYHILQKKDGKWSPAPFKGVTCSWAS